MATTYTTGQGTKTVLNRRERISGSRGNWAVRSFGDDVQTGIRTRRTAERLAAEYARIERRHYRQAQTDHRQAQAAAAALAETVARTIIGSTPDPKPADRHDPARVHAVIIGQFPHATRCGDTTGSYTRTARHVTCPDCLAAVAAGALHTDDAGIALPSPTDTDASLRAIVSVPDDIDQHAARLAATEERIARGQAALKRRDQRHAELYPADPPDGPATIPVRRIVTCYRAAGQPFSACGLNPPQRDDTLWRNVDCPACHRERDRRAAAAADAERAAAASVMHYDTFGVPAMTGCGKPISNTNPNHVRLARTTMRPDQVTCPDCLPAIARDQHPDTAEQLAVCTCPTSFRATAGHLPTCPSVRTTTPAAGGAR